MSITLLERIKELKSAEAAQELDNVYALLGNNLAVYIPSPGTISSHIPSRDFAASISEYLSNNPIETLDEQGIDRILTAIDKSKKDDKDYRDAAKEAYGILTSNLTASYLGWNIEDDHKVTYQFPKEYTDVKDVSAAINKALEEANEKIKESGFSVVAKLRNNWPSVAELYLVDKKGTENMIGTAQYYGDRLAKAIMEKDGHSDIIIIKDDYLFSSANPFNELKDYLPEGAKYIGISDLLVKALTKI